MSTTGRVVAFDAHRGLGTVESIDGEHHPFHCTAITDGTRDIAVGTSVRYEVGPGVLGQWEAVSVTPTLVPGDRVDARKDSRRGC